MVTHMNDKLQSDVFLQLRITSCDILVTMLAHDEAMQFTFNSDSKLLIDTFLGELLTSFFCELKVRKLFYLLDWLQHGEDNPLKTTAALCIGNLCCSKENCKKVIRDFSPALIQALQNHQAPLVRDVKLQHAILSALKNLAVDADNRPILIKNDILPPCLELGTKKVKM